MTSNINQFKIVELNLNEKTVLDGISEQKTVLTTESAALQPTYKQL